MIAAAGAAIHSAAVFPRARPPTRLAAKPDGDMRNIYITPELFGFLRELKRHNDRAWFKANQRRYEAVVRDPLLQFIEDFRPRLKQISRELRADVRTVGGSLFRIQRDTRFSPDKTPYKTHAGVQFRHAAGKDVHAPGFYVHLAPDEVFVATGVWRPDRHALQAIRAAIAAEPAAWRRVVRELDKRGYALEGDSLKRVPGGFEPDHPLAEDLKRTDFVTSREFSERAACRADFVDRISAAFEGMAPLPRFLARALGLAW